MDMAEQFAADCLNRQSLRTERFTKNEMRVSKTPDYRVFKNADLVAYCEAKHVQYDEWLEKQLVQAQPLQLIGGLRHDPIFNRLTAHIHTAHKQFIAVNPRYDHPNILVLANSDRHCTFVGDLLGVLTGNFYGASGAVEPIFKEYSDGRIMFEKMTIDVYVWWNDWQEVERPKMWFWRNSQHYANVSALLGSDPAAHPKVS
jgi:hypothetical protein